jgi:type III secretion protein R
MFSPDPAVYLPLLFLFGLLPTLVVMTTCFAKIVIVFALLKNALGLQQVPPAIVTNGLALVMTWYVMYPVGIEIERAIEKQTGGAVIGRADAGPSTIELLRLAREPLREFLAKHAHPREREFFMQSTQRLMDEKTAAQIKPTDFVVLIPSFALSELAEAFLIGFILFLPFAVIDLVVANVLLALGMQMLSPTMVSLPVKLLLFISLDGWSRLTHALILTYR